MPRAKWLRDQEPRLDSGTIEQLASDLEYCRIHLRIAPLKSERKIWDERRVRIERAMADRFGAPAPARP